MSKTGNLRAIQILLAHTKVGSTIRYLGVGLADTLVGMHILRKRAVRQKRPGAIGTEPSQVRAAVATTTASLSHRHIQESAEISERRDGGGFSGGTMNRFGLQRLLADDRAGRIDAIFVCKVAKHTLST